MAWQRRARSTIPQSASLTPSGSGRNHRLLPPLATNSPLGCLLNASASHRESQERLYRLPSSRHSRCGRMLKTCHRHVFLTHRHKGAFLGCGASVGVRSDGRQVQPLRPVCALGTSPYTGEAFASAMGLVRKKAGLTGRPALRYTISGHAKKACSPMVVM